MLPPSVQDAERRGPRVLDRGHLSSPPKSGSRRHPWPQIHVNPSLDLNQRTHNLVNDYRAIKLHLQNISATTRASNTYLAGLVDVTLGVLEDLLSIGTTTSVKEELESIHALLRRQSEENNIMRLSVESLEAQLSQKLPYARGSDSSTDTSSATTHYKFVSEWVRQAAPEGAAQALELE